MDVCCFSSNTCDLPTQRLDPNNVNQQFEMCRQGGTMNNWGGFVAKSIALDGIPPYLLEKKGWRVCASISPDFVLGEAQGLGTALRVRLPEFNLPLSNMSSQPVVVGKWYCPFMFINEGIKTLKDKMGNSIYYEMTLEQKWEQIFSCENNYSYGNTVVVDAVVQGKLRKEDQRYGEWLRADQPRSFKKFMMVVAGSSWTPPMWKKGLRIPKDHPIVTNPIRHATFESNFVSVMDSEPPLKAFPIPDLVPSILIFSPSQGQQCDSSDQI
ncbi:hypothetical protein SO802_012451 [Lithocarpus litseifolius]|uniref:Uncharacterized protein n=1 Tax=Lithocarpus litseifolius TaxID=425828 RepID=A0AAW2D2T8_9ROSI